MKPSPKTRVAVAVSGGGRSLRNLLDLQHSYEYEICGVVASRPDCGGVAIAEEYCLPIFVGEFSSTKAATTAPKMYEWLAKQKADWLALAGFLKLLPVAPEWEGRIINIHPALLPKHGGHGMYGIKVHEAVKNAGDSVTGASIHYVNREYDTGKIISQITVPIATTDNADEIAKKVFAAECRLYPETLNELVKGTVGRDGQIKKYQY